MFVNKICIFFLQINFVNHQYEEQPGSKKLKKMIFNDRRINEKHNKKMIILTLLFRSYCDYGTHTRWQLLKKIIPFTPFYRNSYVSVAMCFSFRAKVNGVSYIITFVVTLV